MFLLLIEIRLFFFVKIQVLIPPLLQKGKIEKNVYEISVNKLV